jgi:hypothetical protein
MNFRRALLLLLLLGCATFVSAGPKSVPKVADLSVAGIGLNDSKSSRAVLRTDPALIENDTEMPHGMAVNKAGTQVLTFYFHYSGEVMSFSEFKVSLASETKLPAKTIKLANVATFATGKGVKLVYPRRSLSRSSVRGRRDHQPGARSFSTIGSRTPKLVSCLTTLRNSISALILSRVESWQSFALDFVIHDDFRYQMRTSDCGLRPITNT